MDTKPEELDVLELTRALVRTETISANAQETPVLEKIAALLESFGFSCSLVYYDPETPSRANLIAELNPGDSAPALCFGGHIDTVPFGDAAWDEDPLGAVIKDGKLYGRGAADMKSGLAAYICAAAKLAGELKKAGRNIILQIYGGEELGLLGSYHLARKMPQTFKNVGAVIVAEPTSNRPQFGHKGVTWFQLETTGVTAHAAMPDKGDNAISKLIPALCALKDFQPADSHPHLGKSTLVLSVLHAGLNTNSVPDKATLRMDCRTVAGQDMEALKKTIIEMGGPGAELSVPADIMPLWTDPEAPWCRAVSRIVEAETGRPVEVICAEFATDASALRVELKNEPIIVLGPGEQGMAHRTNEYVRVDELYEAQRIYEGIIKDWYKL